MYIIGLTPTPTPAQSLHELILRLIVYRSFSCGALRSSLIPPRRSRRRDQKLLHVALWNPSVQIIPILKSRSRTWWGSRKHALAFSQPGRTGATWAADALGKFEKHRTTSEMHLARHPPGREMTESRKSPQLFLGTRTRKKFRVRRWGRSYNLHVAAQIGLHASLSSLTGKGLSARLLLLLIAPASARLHVGYRSPISYNP